MNFLDPDRVFAVRVAFKKPIFDDDFVERGMQAWFVGWEKDAKVGSLLLYFDFADFEQQNEKYFRRTFYGTSSSDKRLLTAHEAGQYDPKYSVYFGDLETQALEQIDAELEDYLLCLK